MLMVQTDGECRPELSGSQSNFPELDPTKIYREEVSLFDPLEWNRWTCQLFNHVATPYVAPRPFS